MGKPKPPSRGELDPPPEGGYPSAADLPAFRKMKQEIAGLRLLVAFRPSMRKELKRLEKQAAHLTDSIDRFYELLADRHWVFDGSLNLDRLTEALTAGDADQLQLAVIDQYTDPEKMKFDLLRAKAVPELRRYSTLIDLAFDDYLNARFYSTTLTLLPILDQFASAVSDDRRGLHSLEEQKLIVSNSLVAHHKGLGATQRSFTKSFNTVSEEPLHELHRNGILHGNFTNFNNIIVASKAWNRLFALLDWRESLIEAARPPEKQVKLTDALSQLAETRARTKVIEAWQPRPARSVSEHGQSAVEEEPVTQATVALLEAWKAKNYGALVTYLSESSKGKTKGALIGEVRKRFAESTLDHFALVSVEMRGAAAGHVVVDLTVDGTTQRSEFRMLYTDELGHVYPEGDPKGTWRSIATGPAAIVGRTWPAKE